MDKLSNYVMIYKEQLQKGDIRKAYIGLINYVQNLKAFIGKNMGDIFIVGNISQGYMDYTYFPLSNHFLKDKLLRFGIVLNHEKASIELWLMGQNNTIQKKYWEILKTTDWNKHQSTMPQYSVLEVVLSENPDFDNQDLSIKEIMQNTIDLTDDIIRYIKEKE